MRHDIDLEGFDLRLRPVRMQDAAFIVWLRNLDYVKGKVGDSATDVSGQEAWLSTYFERKGDYYFIVETSGGIPLGIHGLYDMHGTSAEQGRNIVRPEVFAGVPAGLLVTDFAFGKLKLKELRANAVSTNVTVHSLLRKSGFKKVGIALAAQIIGGKPVDLVQFFLTSEVWFKVRDSLLPLARQAGIQALEWEKTQFGVHQPWEKSKLAV
jgi:RimJ/RimL family protein N-acetyltransferase